MSHTLPDWLERRLPEPVRPWAARAAPWASPLAFLGGFGLDALTLRRVDDVGDNVQLTLYLVGAAALLVLERRAWHGRWAPGVVARHHGLVRYGLQVLFGGLFSAYFIFYSRSATLGPSVAFCLVLVALMGINELRFARLRPDLPLLAMFFFCLLSYLLFAVPTWTGALGWGTRLASAVLAVGLSAAVVYAVHAGPVVADEPLSGRSPPGLTRSLAHNAGTWVGMLVALLLAMRLGLVPPVPLALAEAGVYHDVRRTEDGFTVTWEAPPWWAFWRADDRVFRYHEGDGISCFTAVFAPSGTQLAVLHAWERFEDGAWRETDRIPWDMRGGRDGGWRSWTRKQNVAPGAWRVRVLSEHGEELGRLRFDVVAAEGLPREMRTTTF